MGQEDGHEDRRDRGRAVFIDELGRDVRGREVGVVAADASAREVGAGECGRGVSLGEVEVCELRCWGEAEGVVCAAVSGE